MAGRVGFEPTAELNPSTHLAGEPNRPLWHLPSIRLLIAAEGEGFEPPVAFTTPVFKTGAIGRSAIPPGALGLPARIDFIIHPQPLQGNRKPAVLRA